MRQSVLATEFVYSTVTAPVDVSGDPVEFAFTSPSTRWPDQATAWITAEWEPDTTSARLLVGPDNGGHLLPLGTYGMWVRVHDNPEVVIVFSGYVTIS